jgi:hypothetical protein
VLEIFTGAVVGVVWGGALLSSVVPHSGVSWQAHVCGGIGGVVAAWLLAGRAAQSGRGSGASSGPGGGKRAPARGTRAPSASADGHRELHDALDRALAQ